MTKFSRLLIALVIFLSGVVLMPFISLPAEAIGWQSFANAYQPSVKVFLPVIAKNR
jgi:hypothetical protein